MTSNSHEGIQADNSVGAPNRSATATIVNETSSLYFLRFSSRLNLQVSFSVLHQK
jgi:hypothetical protein